MTRQDQDIVKEISERLRKSASKSVKKIILYGSRATGEAMPESDFDFLVIEADPVSRRNEMMRFRQSVNDLPYAVDAWVMGIEEFEETKNVIG